MAAAVLLTVAGPANAWMRRTTQNELTPSVVHGKLDGAIATFTARLVVPVEAAEFAEMYSGIDLPALGLVTGATASSRGVPHALGMLPAEEASTKFGALSSDVETARERTSAVLVTGSSGRAEIGIAAAHAGVVTIELTVTAPTCFYRDARYVRVPASWLKVADFSLRRPTPRADALAAACDGDGSDAEGSWIGFPAPELARRPSEDRIGAFAGRLALGEEHIVRAELDLAGTLSEIPRDLATVILVDGSRSMSAPELEAQRQLVASYLRKAPESRVQVIAYARRTKPLLPGWTSASLAATRVDRELRGLAPRNGSNFDVALAEAASWLERIQGTRRIILVTDERMAERLSELPPVTLRRGLPAGTLVHVVAVDAGAQQPVRDEIAKLAPLAASTDGMAVRAGPVREPAALDATLLVRPISLDRVTVHAPGWTQIQPSTMLSCGEGADQLLREGRACTWWGEGDAASGPVVLEGLLWGKRMQRVLRPDANHGRDVARELSALGTLDEKLMERVHTLARAVNDHWSLYVQWGGTGTYTTGDSLGGIGGSGTSCCGSDIGTLGHGSGTGGFWEPPDLEHQLRPLLAACHVEDAAIQVKLEMTLLEIVDLTVDIDAKDRTPAMLRKQQQCVEDALWDAMPMLAHVEPHFTHQVSLPAIR